MKQSFKNVIAFLFFFCIIVINTYAQDKTITGTVKDGTGELPGVSVLVKGTMHGTETDFNGKYTIKAKQGDVLIFSFVGMQTTEKTVGSSSTINVTLTEDSNVLEEVVVVGYGTSTKQAFTGTAKVVKAEVLEAKSVSNISQALAGEAAGVQVINTSGQPGSTATIRIRGFGSVNGNRAPLYVVDGVPFDGSLNSINPSDIATTTILKDATATAIYGSRGANGVVLITTKSGKNGTSNIEIDVKTGVNFSSLPRYSTIKSADEYIGLSWQAMRNKGELNGVADPIAYANDNLFGNNGISPNYNSWNINNVSELIDPATGQVRNGVSRKYTPENWADYGFQTSIRTEANVKFSGGNDKTKYFSSFGYLDDKGYVINSDYKRYSTRLNLTHKPKEWLDANINVGYSYGRTTANGQSEDSGSVFWFVDNIPSIYPLFLRDANGNKIEDPYYGGYIYDYGEDGRGFGALTNSIADAELNLERSYRHSLNGNISFNVKLTDNLTYQTKFGAQYYSLIDNNVQNPFYGPASGEDTKGALYQQQRYAITQNFLNMLKYNKSFGDHNFSALLAHETNQWKRQRTYTAVRGVVNLKNGLEDLSNYLSSAGKPTGYTEDTALESYFGQINYNYNGKYFLSGTLRRDGSSVFHNNKWGTFGSAGASWIISKENFMNNISFVNDLKFKVSYGILGDQNISNIYSGQNGYDVNVDGGGNLALEVPGNDLNSELTWETSKMFQAGLEFTLFNNTIDATVDYYIKNTEDLVFDRRAAISTGNALMQVNDGKLRNSGLEFDITSHIIKKQDFKLDFSINGSFLNNELTAMPIDISTGEQKIIDVSGNYGRSVGHSIYDFYMPEWAGVDSADGNAMWTVHYVDNNGNNSFDSGEEIQSLHEYTAQNPNATILKSTTKNYNEATQKYIDKSVIPTIQGAFRLNAEIHNVSISALFGYSLGGYAYDGAYANLMDNDQIGNNNWHTDIRNAWKQPGDVTNVPRLYSNENIFVNSTSSRFITSTDYLNLSNLRVSYSVPSSYFSKIGLKGINLFAQGDNLFLLSARDGFNPSTSETGASSTYRYSPLTTISFGAKIKF